MSDPRVTYECLSESHEISYVLFVHHQWSELALHSRR